MSDYKTACDSAIHVHIDTISQTEPSASWNTYVQWNNGAAEGGGTCLLHYGLVR